MYLYCVNVSGRMVIFAQFPLKCSLSPIWLLFVLKQVNDVHSGVLNPQQDKHLMPDEYRFLDPIPNLVQQKGTEPCHMCKLSREFLGSLQVKNLRPMSFLLS